MQICIEVTPEDVMKLGAQHERPVTLEQASAGLVRTEHQLDTRFAGLRSEWISRALDVARFMKA